MKSDLIIWIFFIIQNCFILSESNDSNCPRNTPLLNLNNNKCVYEPYNEAIHIISNEIIKIQWLNRMNELGVEKTEYMSYEISSKGDLIIESFIFYNNIQRKILLWNKIKWKTFIF